MTSATLIKKRRHLAIDIGAGSGRLFTIDFDQDGVELQQVYRFDNNFISTEKGYSWNLSSLYANILQGLSQLCNSTLQPESLGLDTWGVDFVLLDKFNKPLSPPMAYRDPVFNQAYTRFYEQNDPWMVYQKTGIQNLAFNTLYQLAHLFHHNPDILHKTHRVALIGDFLNFLLSGRLQSEYTLASTTQLLNVHTKSWDTDLIKMVGLKPQQLCPVTQPATPLGVLSPEVRTHTQLNPIAVVQVCTHDTACAVLGIASDDQDEHAVFLNSGTWSLLGRELKEPIVTEEAFRANFTNEGGAESTIRFLKNISGLWILRKLAEELRPGSSFGQIAEEASHSNAFQCVIDVTSPEFASAQSMTDAICQYCSKTRQKSPQTPGVFFRASLEGLALAYRQNVVQLASCTKRKITSINLAGGGSKNHLLCQMTADATGCRVVAASAEATVLGNALMQAIAQGTIKSVAQGRSAIRSSFKSMVFHPRAEFNSVWENALSTLKKNQDLFYEK